MKLFKLEQANLLLGLGQDCYVCVGNNNKDEARVWIVTRDKDGAVTFWITNEGKHLTVSLKKKFFQHDSS